MTDKLVRQWNIEQRKTEYQGFYRIDKLYFKHSLHDGGWTGLVDRELFMRGNVAAILPWDPDTDRVVLIEQFRIGAMHQSPDPWLLEVIAGMIDTDESPEQVAVREAMEEAGVTVSTPQLVSRYLASPGSTTEEVFVYLAKADLSRVGGVHGLDEEDEDILVHVMSADDALTLLHGGHVKNAISIIALQWFQLYRNKLI